VQGESGDMLPRKRSARHMLGWGQNALIGTNVLSRKYVRIVVRL